MSVGCLCTSQLCHYNVKPLSEPAWRVYLSAYNYVTFGHEGETRYFSGLGPSWWPDALLIDISDSNTNTHVHICVWIWLCFNPSLRISTPFWGKYMWTYLRSLIYHYQRYSHNIISKMCVVTGNYIYLFQEQKISLEKKQKKHWANFTLQGISDHFEYLIV